MSKRTGKSIVMDPRGWFHRARRLAVTATLAITIAAVAMISLTSLPTWPVIGVAFAAAAMVVNSVASRLTTDRMVCLHCARDLAHESPSAHGVTCPGCGAINQRYIVDPAERGESKTAGDAARRA
jgi:phage FluMu protein Com